VAVETVAKAGTIRIIGVYPPTMERYPIGAAMNKNLTLRMGNCNHQRYIPELVQMTRTGLVEPAGVLTATGGGRRHREGLRGVRPAGAGLTT
jgi:threonine dehydrogenase-like Zn-dependent dehydrogenase